MAAQEKLQSADATKAPKLFDATCRHLLAHYKVVKTAGRDGITITVGKKQWNYRDAQLSRDKLKQKLCWFNPDDPSVLVVTDMNEKYPYSVELSQAVSALDPDPEIFAQEMKRIEDYESHGKTRYRVLKGKFEQKFQLRPVTRATVETGIEIRQQHEAISERKAQAQKRTRKIHDRAGKLGLPASIVNLGRDGEEGTALMLEARRRHQEKKQSNTPETL
jgi:hypothetical protein